MFIKSFFDFPPEKFSTIFHQFSFQPNRFIRKFSIFFVVRERGEQEKICLFKPDIYVVAEKVVTFSRSLTRRLLSWAE